MIIAVYQSEAIADGAQPQKPPKTIEEALKIGNIYSPEQFKQLCEQYDLTNYKTVELTT